VKWIFVYIEKFGIKGFISFLYSKINKKHQLLKVKRDDIKVPIYLRFKSTDFSVYQEVLIHREITFKYIGNPNVIIDAGANIGLTSVCFALKFPNTKIIAIEPEIGNYKVLCMNVQHFKNIIPLNCALWKRSEELYVHESLTGDWGFTTSSDKKKGSQGVRHTILGISVDELMKKYKLDKIDLIKIDIEGAEKDLFENATPWIGNVQNIIVELHDRKTPGCSRAFYNNTNGFIDEWYRDQTVYLSRDSRMTSV